MIDEELLDNGTIYVLKHPNFKKCAKVGRTTNVKKRLSSYNTGCPIKGYYFSEQFTTSQAKECEAYLHDKLILEGYEKVHGEWFVIGDEDIKYYLSLAKKYYPCIPEED